MPEETSKENKSSIQSIESMSKEDLIVFIEEFYKTRIEEKDKIIDDLKRIEEKIRKRDPINLTKEFMSGFGTLLIILSGLILYSDKVLASINIQFGIPAKFKDAGLDFQTYIWLLSQTISPLLIILGSILRPYFLSYIIPIYCYCLQLYFIFFDYKIIDDSYLNEYAIGTSVLLFLIFYMFRKIDRYFITKQINKAKAELKKHSYY